MPNGVIVSVTISEAFARSMLAAAARFNTPGIPAMTCASSQPASAI